jgi:spore germination protein KA
VIYIFRRRKKQDNQQSQNEVAQKQDNQEEKQDKQEEKTPAKLEEIEEFIKKLFHNSPDLEIQKIDTTKGQAMIAYIDGLVNKDLIDRDIILPIKSKKFDGDIYTAIKVIYNEVDDINICIQNVLQGNVALFYENNKNILVIEEFKQWDKRQVDEPDAEVVIRGPKEGFNENLRTNTSLIRRRIKTPDLVFEKMILGKRTNTIINIVYIEGIVNQDVLKELKRRLAKISTDSILESGQIEQYIEESPFSPFSGIGITQKPDIVASRILEGRVAEYVMELHMYLQFQIYLSKIFVALKIIIIEH